MIWKEDYQRLTGFINTYVLQEAKEAIEAVNVFVYNEFVIEQMFDIMRLFPKIIDEVKEVTLAKLLDKLFVCRGFSS